MEAFATDELRHHVSNFLKDFKTLMLEGHYYVKGHLKNIETLRDLGITARIRNELIQSIVLNNYSSGPNPDELNSGDYWVFGIHLNDVEIYVKLKIVTYNNGNDTAVCISFHPAEHPLKYPFR